jgi:hypothetical protein
MITEFASLSISGEIDFLKLRNAARDTWNQMQLDDWGSVGRTMGDALGDSMMETFLSVMTGGLYDIIPAFWKGGKALIASAKKWNWGVIGHDALYGLTGGLLDGLPAAIDAVEFLGKHIIDAFKRKLDIHSPSKVFAEAGKMTVVGYAQGVEQESASATRAVVAMAPSGGAAGGGDVSSGAVPGNVTIHLGGLSFSLGGAGGAANAQEIQKVVNSPSFREALIHTLEHAAKAAGIPSMATVVP